MSDTNETQDLEPVCHCDVRRILGRVHVGIPYREAIREVTNTLTTPFRKMPKQARRYLVAAVIQHHKEHRETYRAVMMGDFGRPEPVPRYWFRRCDKAVIIREE
jgi:hypothetical protein